MSVSKKKGGAIAAAGLFRATRSRNEVGDGWRLGVYCCRLLPLGASCAVVLLSVAFDFSGQSAKAHDARCRAENTTIAHDA